MNIDAVRKELRYKRLEEIPLRVTYYARVSTDSEEQLTSSMHQTQYFPEKIKSNPNWVYVDGYVDEGVTGTSTRHRTGFNRMIKDAMAGKFDMIYTKEISRFARNTIDGIVYTRDLLRNGVAIVFENDGINTLDDDSEFRLTIMLGVAQDESRKISRRVKFGHKQSIKQGHVLGTDNMYGYIKKDAKLMIDSETAPIVRRIYEMYASGGYSLNGISKELYAEGFMSRNGTPLATRTLTNMISNPKYKGVYVGGKVEVVDMFTKQQRFISPDEWVVYENCENVPAIVSEELWDEANKRLKKRSAEVKRRQGPQNMHNLFTGKIVCEDCGGTFYKKENKLKDGRKVARWTCSGKINKHICKSLDVYEDELVAIIVDLIEHTEFDTERAIETYRQMLQKAHDGSDREKRREEIQAELEKVAQQRERMIKLNLAGVLADDDLMKILQTNKSVEDDLKLELQSLEPADVEFDIDETISILKKIVEDARLDLKTGCVNRAFVERYIDQISVCKIDDSKVKITVYLANGDVKNDVIDRKVHDCIMSFNIVPIRTTNWIRGIWLKYHNTYNVDVTYCFGLVKSGESA